MRLFALFLLCLAILTLPAHAQWDLQDSHTTASLRGIDNVGGGVAWASGTHGTVLRTEDGGYLWQTCAVPAGAEQLDFRGIQAFDANTAIVMSSGKGDLSRLYKTTDGCKTWKLVFTNPDALAGFYDSLLCITPQLGLVLGDPATGSNRNPVESGYFTFRIRVTHDGGEIWIPIVGFGKPGENLTPLANEGLFAASNTSAVLLDGTLWIGTSAGRVLKHKLYENTEQGAHAFQANYCAGALDPFSKSCGIPWMDWRNVMTPLSSQSGSAGIFSLAFRNAEIGVAVGGDYKQPDETTRTAAYTNDGGAHWLSAESGPHGYRSAVAYDEKTKTWIAVGPNGADLSTDDGKNWRALKPKSGQPADTDKNWNALSLPFVVGANGRIGKLRNDVLKP
jgi:photosystem II stability/assembly factor-like uncharacterized protein